MAFLMKRSVNPDNKSSLGVFIKHDLVHQGMVVVKSSGDHRIRQICIIGQHARRASMCPMCFNVPQHCAPPCPNVPRAYPQVWSNVVRQELVGPRNGLLLVVMQTVQRLKSCIIVIIVGSSIIIISIIFIFCPIVVIIIIPKHAQTLPHIFI